MGVTAKRFGLSSWADVGALAGLLLLGVSFLRWGLKLEEEINAERAERAIMQREIADLRTQVGNGILPRAEERINDHERRISRLEDEN